MPAARDEIGARLRRIEGQVAGLRRMHEEGRYCIDVLDQISALRAAPASLALVILDRHVATCVRRAVQAGEGQERCPSSRPPSTVWSGAREGGRKT